MLADANCTLFVSPEAAANAFCTATEPSASDLEHSILIFPVKSLPLFSITASTFIYLSYLVLPLYPIPIVAVISSLLIFICPLASNCFVFIVADAVSVLAGTRLNITASINIGNAACFFLCFSFLSFLFTFLLLSFLLNGSRSNAASFINNKVNKICSTMLHKNQ